MISNALQGFTENVYSFLTGECENTKGLLVKKHSENLQTHGDYSFPNSAKSWHDFVNGDEINYEPGVTLFEAINKKSEDIIKESEKWDINVTKVKEERGRVLLFLDRPRGIRVGLSEEINNKSILTQRFSEVTNVVKLDPLVKKESDITSLRTRCFHSTVKRLCAINKVDCPIFVTSKSTSISRKPSRSRFLLIAAVLNSKNGAKETNISADDFIRIRQNEMTLIAQHKYGVRVATDSKWKEFVAHLGESAAVFELLQTKPSSAVKINFDCSSGGSSKGASFILYNCARLETIIRTFNEKVTEGTYPPLPDFSDTDFTLLTQEDEWCLIFNYILGFPSLINNCVEINESICEFKPHYLCSFLCSMARVFSQYYRRVRILTEPRKHMLPVMFARIHLLIALNDTLKTCLKILNIKSVSQM